MADNQTNVEIAQKTPAPDIAPQKKIRVGFIFLALVPVAAVFVIETICETPFLILSAIDAAKGSAATDFNSVLDASASVIDIFYHKYMYPFYLTYSILGVLTFGIWYYKAFVKNKPKTGFRQVFGIKSVSAAVGIAFGLYFALCAAMTIAMYLFPKVMEDYFRLMEEAGFTSTHPIAILYVVICGPILEECCMRGLVFGYLKRSGLKTWLVIVITSVLFGVMHLNIVQGIYATVFGLLLGFLRHKYRSIKITVLTHVLFNIVGTYVATLIGQLEVDEPWVFITGGIAMFVLVFVIVLVNGDKKTLKTDPKC